MSAEAVADSSFADVSLTSTQKSDPQVNPPIPTADVPREDSTNDHPSGSTAAGSTDLGSFKYYVNKTKDFYSSNEGAFENAVEDIKAKVIDVEVDGEQILGSWLLLEVDHWDNETEKVVILTSESLLTVRYDFVPKKIYRFKRRALKSFDAVKAGDFEYPGLSLMHYSNELQKRTCSGVRLLWNKGVEPGFLRSWHPASDAMPWQTFTYHPLAFTEEGREKDRYNVKHFAVEVVQAINAAFAKHQPDRSLVVAEEPILQKIYFGFPSQIHNQSFLGMSKDRGMLSF